MATNDFEIQFRSNIETIVKQVEASAKNLTKEEFKLRFGIDAEEFNKMSADSKFQKFASMVTSWSQSVSGVNKEIKALTITMKGLNGVVSTFTLDGDGKLSEVVNQTHSYTKELSGVATKYKELNNITKQMRKEGIVTEKDAKNANVLQQRYKKVNDELQKMLANLRKMGGQYARFADAMTYQINDDKFGLQYEIGTQHINEYKNKQREVLSLQKELIKEQAQAQSAMGKNTAERRKYIESLKTEISLRVKNLDAMKESAEQELKIANENLAKLQKKNGNKKAGVSDSQYFDAQREVENAKRVVDAHNNMKNEVIKDLKLIRQQSLANGSTTKSLLADIASGWKEAAARIVNYTLVYRTLWGGLKLFKDGVQTIEELNKTFTNLQMVTNKTNVEMQTLKKTYAEFALELGSTINGVAEGAETWLRAGKTLEETNELLKTSTMFSKISGMSADDASEKLIAVLNGYRLTADEATEVVDVFNKLDVTAATSAQEIAEAFQHSANSSRVAGIEWKELASIITTVSETTRRSASTIGESMKTLTARYSNIAAGKNIDDEGEAINDVEKVLNKMGIQIRNTKGEFYEMFDVLDAIAKKWGENTDVENAQIATAMAGVRQKEIFLSIMENWDLVKKHIQDTGEASGYTAKKYETYLQSIEAKTNQLKTTFQDIAYQPGFEELYKLILDIGIGVGKLANALVKCNVPLMAFLGIVSKLTVGKLVPKMGEFIGQLKQLGAVSKSIKNGGIISANLDNVANTLNSMKNKTLQSTYLQNVTIDGSKLWDDQVKLNKLKQEGLVLDTRANALIEERLGVLATEKALDNEKLVIEKVKSAMSKEELATLETKSVVEQGDLLIQKAEELVQAGILTEEEGRTVAIWAQNAGYTTQGTILAGIQALIASIAKSMIAFLATPVGIATALAVTAGLALIIENKYLSIEAVSERLAKEQSELNGEYDEASNQLDKINSRLDELRQKGAPTLSDQNEIKKLEIEKQLLEEQIELLEKKKKANSEEIFNNSLDKISEQLESTKPVSYNIHAFGAHQDDYVEESVINKLKREREDAEEKLQALESKKGELTKAEKADRDRYRKIVKEKRDQIDSWVLETEQAFSEAFANIPEGDDEAYDKLYASWASFNKTLVDIGSVTSLTLDGVNAMLKKQVSTLNETFDKYLNRKNITEEEKKYGQNVKDLNNKYIDEGVEGTESYLEGISNEDRQYNPLSNLKGKKSDQAIVDAFTESFINIVNSGNQSLDAWQSGNLSGANAFGASLAELDALMVKESQTLNATYDAEKRQWLNTQGEVVKELTEYQKTIDNNRPFAELAKQVETSLSSLSEIHDKITTDESGKIKLNIDEKSEEKVKEQANELAKEVASKISKNKNLQNTLLKNTGITMDDIKAIINGKLDVTSSDVSGKFEALLSNINIESNKRINKIQANIKTSTTNTMNYLNGKASFWGMLFGDAWSKGFNSKLGNIVNSVKNKLSNLWMTITGKKDKKSSDEVIVPDGGGNTGKDKTSTKNEDVLKEWDKFLKAQKHLLKMSEYRQTKLEPNKQPYADEYEKQIKIYQEIMNRAHEEAEKLRKKGYSDASEEITELQEQWWEAENKIAELRLKKLKDAFDYTEKFYNEELRVLGIIKSSAIEGSSDWIKANTKSIQVAEKAAKNAYEYMTKLKSLDPVRYANEIADAWGKVIDNYQKSFDLAEAYMNTLAKLPSIISDLIDYEKITPLETSKDIIEQLGEYRVQILEMEKSANDELLAGNKDLAEVYSDNAEWLQSIVDSAEKRLVIANSLENTEEKIASLNEIQNAFNLADMELQERKVRAIKEEIKLLMGERNKRVYSDKLGWHWEADTSQLSDKQTQLVETQTNSRVKALEVEIDTWKDYIKLYQDVVDRQKRAEDDLTLNATLGKDARKKILKEMEDAIKSITENSEKAIKNTLDNTTNKFKDTEALISDILKRGNGVLDDVVTTQGSLLNKFAQSYVNACEKAKKAYEELMKMIEEYQEQLLLPQIGNLESTEWIKALNGTGTTSKDTPSLTAPNAGHSSLQSSVSDNSGASARVLLIEGSVNTASDANVGDFVVHGGGISMKTADGSVYIGDLSRFNSEGKAKITTADVEKNPQIMQEIYRNVVDALKAAAKETSYNNMALYGTEGGANATTTGYTNSGATTNYKGESKTYSGGSSSSGTSSLIGGSGHSGQTVTTNTKPSGFSNSELSKVGVGGTVTSGNSVYVKEKDGSWTEYSTTSSSSSSGSGSKKKSSSGSSGSSGGSSGGNSYTSSSEIDRISRQQGVDAGVAKDMAKANERAGKKIYDQGGVLYGLGGIKATTENEMVLPPDVTKKMLEPSADVDFRKRLSELRYLYGSSQSTFSPFDMLKLQSLPVSSSFSNIGTTNNSDNSVNINNMNVACKDADDFVGQMRNLVAVLN